MLLLSPFTPHLCRGAVGAARAHGRRRRGRLAGVRRGRRARGREIEIPVQVNGKVRGRVTVPADAAEADIEAAALASPQVQPHLAGKQVVKVIVAQRPARQHRGATEDEGDAMTMVSRVGCLVMAVALLAVAGRRAAATRWPAAATRCRRTSRSSACRTFVEPVADAGHRPACSREAVREEFAEPRPVSRSMPDDDGRGRRADRRRSSPSTLHRRRRSTRTTRRRSYAVIVVGERRVQGRARQQQGALVQSRRCVLRDEYDVDAARRRRPMPRRSSARTRTRSIASPRASPASLVTSILEAF